MPLLLAIPLAIVIALAVTAVLLPLSLLQRFRQGKARRQARGWQLALNLWSALLGSVLFAGSVALAGIWWPGVWSHAALGFAAGLLLGWVGIALTRFQASSHGLFYQPNLWLVLSMTLLVLARVVAGVVQAWRSLAHGLAWPQSGWLSHASLLAMAGLLLGYALSYAWWLRRRWRRHQRYYGYDRTPR